MSITININLDALTANYRYYRERTEPALCAAVVKANAYGLGLEPVAKTLYHAGCRHFYVATHKEGMQLRSVLADVNIYIFEGATAQSVDLLMEHDLIPVLNSEQQAGEWITRASSLNQRLPALIHIDSGMTRLGFGEQELRRLAESGANLERLDIRYVLTHFTCADQADPDLSSGQLNRFNELRALIPAAPTCIGNSAGALLGAAFAGDMARVGIALYGSNPYLEHTAPLQPVLLLQSRILQLRVITRDTPVGYGATYTAKSGTRIATVGFGYADGYPWSLGNRGIAVIGGHRVPVVGRVSMDLITLDVTGLADELVQPGCPVELIGPDITLDELAKLAGTISYEILTGLGQRASRNYHGGHLPSQPGDLSG